MNKSGPGLVRQSTFTRWIFPGACESNSGMKSMIENAKSIGEVRTKVRLRNINDVLRAEEGKLKPSKIRSCEADALVDTGAVRSTGQQAEAGASTSWRPIRAV